MSASLGGPLSRSSFHNCLVQKYLFSGDGSYLCFKFLVTRKDNTVFEPFILLFDSTRMLLPYESNIIYLSLVYVLFCFLRTGTE